ncbi:type VI secretion system protein TssA [Hahella aquimaris]|uniref:type VI secretion system protein TssA n=1 Tax=Hahella sp. HNIBRBA332 TaxID=3015983 RepID=UPI00273BCE8D|nr:type VI secretion system protein TssA [Hahella sp. HNIBRBA332]WLQ17110.1 type VI secretion system protein TssA [Hahella sp. HNIBRBA332]
MASDNIIELEPFFSPISDENPSGTDLRDENDSDFSAAKAARRKVVSLAKAARFDANGELELVEQWREIRRLAPTILKRKSKDLEVAAWFTEALLKLEGFTGLRDGLQIIKGLVENFWDTVYPLPDEDGVETRIYPLISLNGEDGTGTLVLPIKNTPLTDDTENVLTLTSYGRLQDALNIEDPEERIRRFEELSLSEDIVNQQLLTVSPDKAQNIYEDIQEALALWQEIGELVDAKCSESGSKASLPTSGVKNALQEVEELYKRLMKNKLLSDDEVAPVQSDGGQAGGSTGGGGAQQMRGGVAHGPFRSREDAINHLLVIAEYFRKTEPHSPLCGAIERVANWGRMSIQELLMELIPDEEARARYALMTGIQIGEDAAPIGQLSQTARAVTIPEPKAKAEGASEPAQSSGENWDSGGGGDSSW